MVSMGLPNVPHTTNANATRLATDQLLVSNLDNSSAANAIATMARKKTIKAP
jgi:hypothetical protein